MSGWSTRRSGTALQERRILVLVEIGLVDQRRHPRQIDRTVASVQVEFLQIELMQQQLRQVLRTAGGDFQPHREAELALRQLALQRLPQILDFLFVEPQVRVAGDSELRIIDDLALREQLVQMRMDDRRQQDEGIRRRDIRRQLDHPRQHPRRLDDGDRGLATERVAARKLDDEVEALVDDLRERVRRIEPDRRQQRLDLAPEIVGDPLSLRFVAVRVAQQPDSGGGHRGQHLLVERAVFFGNQRLRFLADAIENRAHVVQRHSGRGRLGPKLLAQARDAYFEKLVEIAADDAKESKALEQRNAVILRKRQYAAVERQLRKLAVDQRRIAYLHGIFGCRRASHAYHRRAREAAHCARRL